MALLPFTSISSRYTSICAASPCSLARPTHCHSTHTPFSPPTHNCGPDFLHCSSSMLSPTLASLAIFGIAILPSLSYAIDVALPPLPVLAQPLTGANGHVVGKAHLSKTDLRHLVAGRQVSAQDLREKRAFGKVKRHQGNGPQAPVAPAPSTASCASAKYDRSGQCCPTQRSVSSYWLA